MEIDRTQIDWLQTATNLRAALAERGHNIVWLSTQLAEKHGFSDSSRSELYALSKGKPFKLSERKLLAIFDILGIKPALVGAGAASVVEDEPKLAFCSKVDCRCSEWALIGFNGWTAVPKAQWVMSDVEEHCRFCGEKSLIRECPNCGHPLREGSHCAKCGAPYTPLEGKSLDRLLDLSPSTENEAELAMLWRKVGRILTRSEDRFPGIPLPMEMENSHLPGTANP